MSIEEFNKIDLEELEKLLFNYVKEHRNIEINNMKDKMFIIALLDLLGASTSLLVRRKGLEPLSKPEQDILNYKYKETKKILNKSFNEFEHLINGSL